MLNFLTVARLVEKKENDYSIKAITKLLNKHKNIQYTIVRSGPLKQQWRNLASDLKIENNVRFIPAIDQNKIATIYNESHIFILAGLTANDGQQKGYMPPKDIVKKDRIPTLLLKRLGDEQI